ncbi:MAG TPA: proton-conducting transporter membrane subunit [Candidatus Bathyarchaeia archaeon]|nr:proton-conducting transporter membrane subunit [Candidatus Bathyarchaeia archaeon]
MAVSSLEIAFAALFVGALFAGSMRSWRASGIAATFFVALATVLAWIAGWSVLLGGQTACRFIVALPWLGSELAVSLDPLGAAFVILITGVSLFATIYSVGYMGIYRDKRPGTFYLLLQLFIAGMVGVACVADWLFFIVLWEMMTLASYFLVTFERDNPAVARAGFKYFVMTHVASAGLIVAAVVLWRVTGSFGFEAHRSGLMHASLPLRSVLLALYFVAFATKAGIYPFGDWLPDAHPAAPSGVSAILSGVMIKLGAYGLLRVFWGLAGAGAQNEMMTWGIIVASFGVLSAFLGGLTAMRENDAKRLLAYSSISQTGYIFLALGIWISFAGRGGLASLATLALLGAGFHILNDAIYKSLLFMNAGSILYSTGTRDLGKVGGISPMMPLAAAAGLVGVLSLSGLPPTNGFASKWIIYQASISGGFQFAPFIAAAVVAFFVSLTTLAYSLKFYCSAFFGPPAAGAAPRAIPRTMSFAQAALALACLGIGVAPVAALRVISGVFGSSLPATFRVGFFGGLSTAPAGPEATSAWSPLAVIALLIFCFVLIQIIRHVGRAGARSVPNWYGGEEHPGDDVRYRAQGLYSSFNEIFPRVYPRLTVPRPPTIRWVRSVVDLDTWLYGPLVRKGERAVDKVSRSHVGIPQLYMIWQVAGMVLVIVILFLLVR